MEKNLKNYEYKQFKTELKKSIFIITSANNVNTIEWQNLNKKLKSVELKKRKTTNTSIKRVLLKTVFQKYKPLIVGSTVLIKPKKSFKIHEISGLTKLFSPEILVLALKLKHKIYPAKLVSLNYSIRYKDTSKKVTINLNKIQKKITRISYTLKTKNN